jgi:hypothetical protein
LDLSPAARAESLRLRAASPAWARWFELPLRTWGRMRRLVNGTYHQAPFDYEIYTRESLAQRVRVHVANPTCVWYGRSPRQAGGLYRRTKLFFGVRPKTPS